MYYDNKIKNSLLFWTVGSGKTIGAMSIINSIITLLNKDFNIFIIVPKSLLESVWVKETQKWIQEYT